MGGLGTKVLIPFCRLITKVEIEKESLTYRTGKLCASSYLCIEGN